MERLDSIEQIITKYSVASSSIKSTIYTLLGIIFVSFAIIGIFIPGWPTISWAVPAAFLFSLSNEKLFRWTLSNDYFGSTIFEYYATGKTIPKHAKYGIISLIGLFIRYRHILFGMFQLGVLEIYTIFPHGMVLIHQTHKLYKMGWNGINLDISKESIESYFNDFNVKKVFY